jgi:hypothetical protein
MAARAIRTRPPRGRLVALVAASAVLAPGGCGGSGSTTTNGRTADQTSVRKLLSDLQAAAVAGDGTRICTRIFTPKLARSVATSARSGRCADEVRRNLFSPTTRLTVRTVTVADAANATATVEEAPNSTSTVFLVRQSGRWRIRSVQPA